MDLSIKDKDVKNYELTKVEVKTSKDGKARYAVCEFRQAGLRKVLQEQTRPVVMQLMAAIHIISVLPVPTSWSQIPPPFCFIIQTQSFCDG